jgi:hypothetical protein
MLPLSSWQSGDTCDHLLTWTLTIEAIRSSETTVYSHEATSFHKPDNHKLKKKISERRKNLLIVTEEVAVDLDNDLYWGKQTVVCGQEPMYHS